MLKPVDGAPPFVLELSPSRYLTGYIAAVHLCVLAVLVFYPLAEIYRFGLAALLLLHWVAARRRFNDPDCPGWISSLTYSGRELTIASARGRVAVGVVEATVWSGLVVVNLSAESGRGRYRLVIFPDSAPAEQRRQLRVFLRHCLVVGEGLEDA